MVKQKWINFSISYNKIKLCVFKVRRPNRYTDDWVEKRKKILQLQRLNCKSAEDAKSLTFACYTLKKDINEDLAIFKRSRTSPQAAKCTEKVVKRVRKRHVSRNSDMNDFIDVSPEHNTFITYTCEMKEINQKRKVNRISYCKLIEAPEFR
jgi:hypothetical protein